MSSTAASAGADAPLRIICGPTAAGKSALALALAERHGAWLLSADSRQVYRGFDLGTAKPTAAERGRVPHRGLDVAEPTERWSAARWAQDAARWLDEAAAAGHPALLVGGSGLWLRALVRLLADEPPMDPDRRRAMQDALGALPTTELRRWVAELDASRAHLGRTQLLRAAEVALLTGTRLSDWHAAGAAKPRRAARWLVVDPGEALPGAIAGRLDRMLISGWPEEVRRLAGHVPPDAPAWNACGYREIREAVDAGAPVAAVRDRILVATRQYAKRQRTWFRTQLAGEPDVLRLDPRAPDALARADRWFRGSDDA